MSEVTVPKKQMNALYLSWVVALTATLSALFIGEILGKTPCLLCWITSTPSTNLQQVVFDLFNWVLQVQVSKFWTVPCL